MLGVEMSVDPYDETAFVAWSSARKRTMLTRTFTDWSESAFAALPDVSLTELEPPTSLTSTASPIPTGDESVRITSAPSTVTDFTSRAAPSTVTA